jgi:hypothetical protein
MLEEEAMSKLFVGNLSFENMAHPAVNRQSVRENQSPSHGGQ